MNTELASHYDIGNFLIDIKLKTITRKTDKKSVKLSKSEILIVKTLAENRSVTVSREHLINHCWEGRVVTDSSLTVAIRNIRNSFALIGEYDIIITEPKKGYSIRASAINDDSCSSQLNLNQARNTSFFPYFYRSTLEKNRTVCGIVNKATFNSHLLLTVCFLFTLCFVCEHLLFIKKDTLNGIYVHYGFLDFSKKKEMLSNLLSEDILELITYPNRTFCFDYQVIGLTSNGLMEFSNQIDKKECNDELDNL